MSLNAQWMQRDLAVLWHPRTQMKDHERLPVIPIKRGDGVWLEDFDGKRYLDAYVSGGSTCSATATRASTSASRTSSTTSNTQ